MLPKSGITDNRTTLNFKVPGNYLRDVAILDQLPVGLCVCDMSGMIVKCNEQAVKIWGREPKTGNVSESFCGGYKLFRSDGTAMLHNVSPMAECIRDGEGKQNEELIIERPDKTRVWVEANIIPLYDEKGNQVGAINCFTDITEKRKIEVALSKKTKELEDYVENAAIGLHWVDENGIVIWTNQAELDMLGYEKEEYLGHHISEFHVSRDIIDDILKKLSRNETIVQCESELRCKNGSVKTVHITSNVFWNDNKFIHTRCFTVDVTTQTELLKALKESESKYIQLIKNLQTPLYATDEFGKIQLYNDAAVELWGREPIIGVDEWCGSYKILDKKGAEMPLDKCPMAFCLKEKQPMTGEEIIVIRPDGSLRNVVPNPQPIFENGKMVGAINMLIDITELKQIETALRKSEDNYRKLAASLEQEVENKVCDLQKKTMELVKSEERYHKMVEEVEDYAILLLDKDGYILNWNKGAEKIKGFSESEIIGKNFQEFYLDEDKENGLPARLLDESRKTGKALHEGWRKRKDGSTFWGSIVLTALHDEQKNVIGFSKVTRDLTEKKIWEDKMKDYLKQLEFQNTELEQFVYAASHDLKEPLRKIQFFNDFVMRSSAELIDEKSKDYLNRSITSANRMAGLIDNLLTYSKTTSKVERYGSVDLNVIVEEVLSQHKEELERANAKIEISDLQIINAVSFQIKQLLFNLINNCIKYKHPERDLHIKIIGSIAKSIEIKSRDLDMTLRYQKISIIDNGIGFEPQYSQKIFEVFQRLTGANDNNGSGIGLAICKKIIQNHNGYIYATGKINSGATISFYIPLN